jgi:hypothetical protein
MYPINTILTFTSLTHASAAADLFGGDALESLTHSHRADYDEPPNPPYWRQVFEHGGVWQANKWRIILDTPEKVKWFEPQVLDAFKYCGGISIIREIRGDKILHDRGILKHSDIKAIIQRNDQPFPQPQDVKLGEGV